MSEEEWDFVDGLKQTRSSCVCMTCQHFSYVCDQHCHTLLTCGLQRRQVPHGEHLTKRCRNWMVRREAEMGGARRWRDERGMVDRRRRSLDMALLA